MEAWDRCIAPVGDDKEPDGVAARAQPDASDVPAAPRGLDLRMEDDVRITEAGPEVLTAAILKVMGDIEATFDNQSTEPLSCILF